MEKHCVVLGGGLSGLAAAYFLKAASRYGLRTFDRITLLESADRFGGWVETVEREGFLFERGPRGFRPSGNGHTTLRLIEELGIDGSAIKTSSRGKNRYVWARNQMIELPSSPTGLLRRPDIGFMLASAAVRDLTTRKREPFVDESVFDFVARRFGEPVASLLVDAMVSGIYAGNSRELSVKSCFPILRELEAEHGSVVRGMFSRMKQSSDSGTHDASESTGPSLFGAFASRKTDFTKDFAGAMQVSFDLGMGTLPRAMVAELEKCDDGAAECNVSLRTRSKVIDVRPQSLESASDAACSKKMRVTFRNEEGTAEHLHADHVISALPASPLCEILSREAWFETKEAIRDIADTTDPVDVAVVNMGWHRGKSSDDPTVQLPYDGFGFLVPSMEFDELLGVTWDSLVFPQQQQQHSDPSRTDDVRITAMLGGAHHPHIGSMRSNELEELAMEKALPRLNIDQRPDVIEASVSKQCIPQYGLGHQSRVDSFQESLALRSRGGFVAIGPSLCGVGVADLVHNALKAAAGARDCL
eukprot:g477.t1